MTEKEMMQMALDLEKLADRFSEGWHTGIQIDASDVMLLLDSAEVLRAAIAQPEPKPVAWMLTELDGTPLIDCGDLVVKQRPVLVSDKTDCIPLYTAPSQREWQGLTDEERLKTYLEAGSSHTKYGKAIEAKLKEKNT